MNVWEELEKHIVVLLNALIFCFFKLISLSSRIQSIPIAGGAAAVTRGARSQHYDLSGLVVHHGRALRRWKKKTRRCIYIIQRFYNFWFLLYFSGHYTAYANSWQRPKGASRWLHYNDNIVKPVEVDEVCAQQSGAYILFYVRRWTKNDWKHKTRWFALCATSRGKALW